MSVMRRDLEFVTDLLAQPMNVEVRYLCRVADIIDVVDSVEEFARANNLVFVGKQCCENGIFHRRHHNPITLNRTTFIRRVTSGASSIR